MKTTLKEMCTIFKVGIACSNVEKVLEICPRYNPESKGAQEIVRLPVGCENKCWETKIDWEMAIRCLHFDSMDNKFKRYNMNKIKLRIIDYKLTGQ